MHTITILKNEKVRPHSNFTCFKINKTTNIFSFKINVCSICLFFIFLIHFDDTGDKILGKNTQTKKKNMKRKTSYPWKILLPCKKRKKHSPTYLILFA